MLERAGLVAVLPHTPHCAGAAVLIMLVSQVAGRPLTLTQAAYIITAGDIAYSCIFMLFIGGWRALVRFCVRGVVCCAGGCAV